jgi:hypothetical protein
MDLQFWIYVAIVVLSILAQARKKKKQQEQQDFPAPGPEQPAGPKPISFEDLLREIQQSKQPEPPKPALPQPAYPQYDEVVDYEKDLEVEERSLEQPAPTFANSYEIYEKAKADAFVRPSLEETMKVEDTEVRFGQFDKYKKVKETVPATGFAETFQDFDQFKRAFVMAEILKPKF